MTPIFPSSQISLILRLFLLPLAPVYGLVVRLRPAMYRLGWLKTQRLRTPVIAVGNLTLGGSGKSPMVEYLLREARRGGLKAVAISRGYRRRGRGLMRVRLDDGGIALAHQMGDEPCMLALRNPALPVYVGKDRVAAGRLAEILDAPDVIVLDDAYQHLRLARDLNVLLVDAEQGLGNGLVLPLGDLREPSSAIRRADVVLITKTGLGGTDALQSRLEALLIAAGDGRGGSGAPAAPLFRCGYVPRRLLRLDGGAELPLTALKGREAALWCAIAQPGGFRKTVEGMGAEVAEVVAFRDHHPYGEKDVKKLDALLAQSSGDGPLWLTTGKDAVKLRGRLAQGERLWVLEMEVEPEPAAQAFFFDFLSALKLR